MAARMKSIAARKTMEFNMAGKAILRAFLILGLIVTAHLIKPFSIKSVSQHLLYSTRSFRFVLPVRLRDRFDHANYLAINLSDSLFEVGKGIQNFTMDANADFGLVAIKAQPLDEVNKSATKQKPCAKKSAPAKRIIKPEKVSASDLVASVNSDEILPVELPPAPIVEPAHLIIAPPVKPCLTRLLPLKFVTNGTTSPIEIMLALRKVDCGKREAAQVTWVTCIEEEKKLKAAIRIAEKQKAERTGLLTSECEERKTEIVTEGEELELKVTGPEDESIMFQNSDETRFPSPLELVENCSREP
jgi:hypothetical protein